ncbi:hypothetical protein A2U01_0020325 [Trifolium medium]|uniref:Uncharacterized protein n=1 Tax=Trifolium medium TaxID=97028 RepID=A0A392NIW4_9FABA|nr:hypothetical protein [Trifolium medium]
MLREEGIETEDSVYVNDKEEVNSYISKGLPTRELRRSGAGAGAATGSAVRE